jgi:hypothetical protein
VSIDWVAIENAIHAWVTTASGLAGNQVIWTNQNGIRPGQSPPAEAPFITLQLGSPQVEGQSFLQTKTDLTRSAGQEIELQANALQRLTCSVQAFGSSTTGNNSAGALLSQVETKLRLPSLRSALNAAGLSPFNVGPIKDITQLFATAYESRAVLNVLFYVQEQASEFTGYIESVEIEEEDTGDIFTTGVAPVNLGGVASAMLGAAAGVGATLGTVNAWDGGGSITFTAGTGAQADGGVLLTITFSRVLGAFFMTFADGSETASEENVAEQLYVAVNSGNQALVLIDNVGAPLVAGRTYTVKYTTAF